MTCAGCSNHVATTLKALDGVVEQQVEYPGDVATIKYNLLKHQLQILLKPLKRLDIKL